MIKNACHWIDGNWVPSASGAVAESVNPSTGEVLGRFADAGAEDGQAAIAAALRPLLPTGGC